MLQEKGITLSGWIENMHKNTTPSDDMCLYLLTRMFNKHVYVHNKLFYWCTAIHKISHVVDLELINDCAIELVFVHPWVFGEVRKVRLPKGHVAQNPVREQHETLVKTSDIPESSITENVEKDEITTRGCSIALTCIDDPDLNSQNPTTSTTNQAPKRSCRKRTVRDYSKLLYLDEADLDKELPPSPVKKKRPTNLLRKPSRTRQKIERNRRRNKRNRKNKASLLPTVRLEHHLPYQIVYRLKPNREVSKQNKQSLTQGKHQHTNQEQHKTYCPNQT